MVMFTAGCVLIAIICQAPWTAKSMEWAEKQLSYIGDKLGCPPNDISCLRNVTSSALLKACKGIPHDPVNLNWSPVVDGVELLDNPQKLGAAGRVADVPVLLGTNQVRSGQHVLEHVLYIPKLSAVC